MKRVFTVVVLVALLTLIGAQATWATPSSGPIVHIVRWGENLISIARRYGVTVYAIASTNGIANTNRIYAGQRLVIPGTGTSTPAPVGGCTYVVRPGDNLTNIAYRHGVTIYQIVRLNGIVNPNRIYVGQRLAMPCAQPPAPVPPTPAPGGVYYVVRAGDTLAKIAVRFGVSIWSIVQANSIPNPNLIHVGQRLFIPRGTPPPVPVTKPGCEHLSWPKQGAVLSGVVGAWGTADHVNFDYYKIEVRRDGLDDWHYVTGQSKPVHNGPLGAWDTRTVSDGPYTFRLVIVDKTGNYPPPCEIAVRVRNDP
ncbi:MAG: LysM peptidoglycan-binding domain-containing protein [Anaerolineae bacterium]|nr:LysM peptidoglycan-binding domain-containing protein [Anaerolineae bacterium]